MSLYVARIKCDSMATAGERSRYIFVEKKIRKNNFNSYFQLKVANQKYKATKKCGSKLNLNSFLVTFCI